jgi:two-component system response regulator AtoC
MTATKTPAETALKILIVDDDRSAAYALDRALTENGHEVAYAFSAEQGLKSLKESPVDVVLLDLVMPGMDGTEMPAAGQKPPSGDRRGHHVRSGGHAGGARHPPAGRFRFSPQTDPMAGSGGRDRPPPSKTPKIQGGGGKDRPLSALFTVPDLMGQSEGMKRISAFIQKISSVTSSVLIRGETGTGKEIAAHGIHNRSPRRDGPFIAVNCSALPETMLESELFGHEKGAFTDATGLKRGLLEVSGGGTLFLDEIGDMPLALQAKLLRVVETKRFRRLGSTVEHAVDVRFLAATHRDLEEMVRKGQFREDLFYRLSVFTLVLPPLRERREDIAPLADFFLKGLTAGRASKTLSPDALEHLVAYPWPGNVRELHNVMEHVVVFSDAEVIAPADLPPHVMTGRRMACLEPLAAVERRHVERVFAAFGGDVRQTAKSLGISESDLAARMARYRDAGPLPPSPLH